MTTGTETTQGSASQATRSAANYDALAQTNRELMQAEVRLAKARATVVSSEIDIKTLTTRLRELTR